MNSITPSPRPDGDAQSAERLRHRSDLPARLLHRRFGRRQLHHTVIDEAAANDLNLSGAVDAPFTASWDAGLQFSDLEPVRHSESWA